MMTNFYTLEREWRMRDMAHSRVMAWLRQISCLFGGQSQRPKVLKGITFGGKVNSTGFDVYVVEGVLLLSIFSISNFTV